MPNEEWIAWTGVRAPVSTYRRRIIRGTATVLASLATLFGGCRGMGTQGFTALAPSQARELTESCQVVFDARCTDVTWRADYNLWENLHMLAPKARRWKFDMTLQVERVVQGDFAEPSLRVHWTRDPVREQSEVLGVTHRGGFVFTNGMPLRVGFDSYSGAHLRNLKLMVRHD